MICETYYDVEKIRISYNEELQGYWLFLGTNSHFLNEKNYNKISEISGKNLPNAFNKIDPKINMDIRQENIKISSLEKAFNTVKEFKKTQ